MSTSDDWTYLKARVNSVDADDSFVQQCWNTAVDLVTVAVGQDTAVTDSVFTECCLRVGMNLFQARVAQQGLIGVEPADRPYFAPKDPLTTVWPLLKPFGVGYL